MEENLNNNQQPKMQEQKKKEPSIKTKKRKAKAAVITLSTIGVLLLGLQVYASTNGYGNVFFMIKNLITTGNPAGNQEIFSDKDITLSYKSIEVAEGLKIQANRLEIKDGKTKLYLSVKSESYNHLPLKYDISTTDNTGKLIKDNTRAMGIAPENDDDISYEEILTLDYEVGDNDIIIIKVIDVMEKELRTLEINLQTREITVKGEKDFEKISEIELKKYLGVFSQVNNGAPKADTLLYMACRFQGDHDDYMKQEDFEQAKNSLTDREFKNQIIKEFYGDNAEFENIKNKQGKDVEILKGLQGWEYDKENDSYAALTAGEDYHYGRCLKIEDVKFENDIYTIKYVYMLLTDNDQMEANIKNNLEDLPQYETTIKLKRNENNTYSKYEIVSLESGTEVKNKVSTSVNDDTDVDFFEKNANLQYNKDLTNPENGKAAIIKSGEEVLKTTQNNGYYTYTDMWNNSYNIKKIKDVKSEFRQLGKDKQSALYKCTIYYIDNNNQDKSFDVAVIVSKDAEGGILGTYDSYTGSTRYTRWVGLYNENEEENNANTTTNSQTTHYSREELMDLNNWVEYWPDVGMKFKLPKSFEQGQVSEVPGNISVNMSGHIVLPILHYERETDPKYEGVPVRIAFYTEIRNNNVNMWDVLENSQERSVRSTDNKQWSDWYPLQEDNIPTSTPNGFIRRSYGRVRGDMVEKVIFDMQTNNGMDTPHYEFIRNVLESVTSTSR